LPGASGGWASISRETHARLLRGHAPKNGGGSRPDEDPDRVALETAFCHRGWRAMRPAAHVFVVGHPGMGFAGVPPTMGRTANGMRLLLAALLAVACGGIVEGGSRQSKESAPASGQSGSGSGQSSAHGSDNPNADTDLGDCVLGVPEQKADNGDCAWVADGRCYEARDMACNCSCPRSHDSQCVSGFEAGPNGHVDVSCL
jgi:hypothetical protein